MKALCLSLLLAVAAAAAVPAEPGPLLVPGQDDAGWRELFAALAAQGPVWSAFTEHRWFSVKKEPVVLSGELRHSAARGLSLHYTAPEEQLAVIDARGVLLRSAKGRTREIAADPHHPQADAALLPVMRGDLPELEKSFEVHAAREGDDWRLDFVPRDPALARQTGTITVSGSGRFVRRLQFQHSARQRVEVLIGETRTGVTFTPEEEKRFFR